MSLTWIPPPSWAPKYKMFYAILSDKIHIQSSKQDGFAVPGNRLWPCVADWVDHGFENFVQTQGANVEETPLIPLFDDECYAERWGKRLWEMGHKAVRIGIIMLPSPRLVYIRMKFSNGQKHLLPALSESQGPVTLVSVPQIRECFGVNMSIHTRTGWFSLTRIPRRMVIAVNPVSDTDVGWPYNLLVARQERERLERKEREKREEKAGVKKEEEEEEEEWEEEDEVSEEWEVVKTEEGDDFSVVSLQEENRDGVESVKTQDDSDCCAGYSNCATN